MRVALALGSGGARGYAHIGVINEISPGTFDKRWSELTPGQQSAVIVAVEAAADALCS